MDQQDICVSSNSLQGLLQDCIKKKNLVAGRRVCSLVFRNGQNSLTALGSHLIRMFALCGSLSEATFVFDNLQKADLFAWGSIISANARLGRGEWAVELYYRMLHSTVKPNEFVFNTVLKACSSIAALDEGKQIHAHILESSQESSVIMGNVLIDMYAKCGSFEDAYSMFRKLEDRTVVTWSAMIAACAYHGHVGRALQLFQEMQQNGVKPNFVTYVMILKTSSTVGALSEGKQIHSHIVSSGCDSDICVGNSLVDMYCKCGRLDDASRVFIKLLKRDVLTWSAMITGYIEHGLGLEAFFLYQQMQLDGVQPDDVTFVCMLKACSSIAVANHGRLIHDHIVKVGYESDAFIGRTLVYMYAQCGSLEDARVVFDKLPRGNVVAWNTMITGYVRHGQGREALELFQQMQKEGIKANNVTIVGILKACSAVEGTLDQGKLIHDHISEGEFELNLFVGSTLVDMYAKCGSLENAWNAFRSLPKQSVVTWNAMITGYAHQGCGQAALQVFHQMQQEGMEPDTVTFVSLLRACSGLLALEQGILIHACIIKVGSEIDIGNSLIDMYCKCGSLEDACCVFGKLPKECATTWNAMVAGFAHHSDYKSVLQYFESMNKHIKPNDVTFVCLLSACSRMGLVDMGCQHFESMLKDHHIKPTLDHYNCIIDLFSRAGLLEEAEALLQTMPLQPDIVGWMSLLSNCRTHGNVELGKRSFLYVVSIDPENPSGYLLMESIFLSVGTGERVDGRQGLKAFLPGWKKPGTAFIEVDRKLHGFTVGDQSHQCSNAIVIKLKELTLKMRDKGYVPCGLHA